MWLYKKLRGKLKTKRDRYREWKGGQATKEEHREVEQHCRNGIRKAQAENELRLRRDTKSNLRAFFRYMH